jgi:ATP-binding cassette subfamily B protein
VAAPASSGDTEASRRDSPTRKAAVLLALRYYGREVSRLRRVALPALLLPVLGDICLRYLAPLIVAKLAGRLVRGADAGNAPALLPYVRSSEDHGHMTR